MKKVYLLSLFAVFILSGQGYAYIDPGTGGMIVGSIWPIILAFFAAIGAFLVKVFWRPVKGFFSKSKDKGNETEKK